MQQGWQPKVDMVSVEKIVPYARNARVHSKEQVENIARAISSTGFMVPIVVDIDMVIISGHGRLLAAQALDIKEVPVIIADHLNEQEITAARIADNQLASQSTWDMPMLAFELGTLERHEVDLRLTGFNLDEAKSILVGFGGGVSSGDDSSKEGAKEHSEEDYQEFAHTCPKCNFQWN